MAYTEISFSSFVADEFPDPIAILDTKGTILWCNKATFEISKLTPNEIIGKRFTKLSELRVRDIPGFVKMFALVLTGRSVKPFKLSWKLKDGTTLHSEARIKLIKVFGGQRAIQLITRDLTEITKVTNQLKDREKKLRDFFQNAQVPLFRSDIETGLVLDCNKMGAVLFGYKSPKEVIGRVKASAHYVNPEERLELMNELNKNGKCQNYQLQMRKVTGEDCWVELSARIYQEQGYLESVAVDMTYRKEAEEKLRQSEERYRSLVEHIPDAVWTSDLKGINTYISPNVLNICGFTPDEVNEARDRVWFGSIHPDDVEQVKQAFQQLFKTGDSMNVEYRFQRKDGIWIWLYDRSTGIYEKNGTILASGVFSDITQRKQMEVALTESEERFRSVFEESGIANNLYDSNGVLIGANQACVEMFGVKSADDLLGFNLFEDPNLPKEVVERVQKGETQRILSEFSFEKVKEEELYTTSKSGIHFFDSVVVPFGISDNRSIEGFFVQLLDVTESINTQRALRESEALFRAIYESAGIGMTRISLDHRILGTNPALQEMLGFSNDEFVQMVPADFTHPEDIENDIRLFDEIVENKGNNSYRLLKRYIRKDGSQVWGNLTVSLVENDEGNPQFAIAMIEEVTKRIRTTEKLRESEERYRTMAETIRDGLTILEGYPVAGTVFANDRACEIFGYPRNEFMTKTPLDLVVPEEKERIQELFNHGLKTGEFPDSIEYWVHRKDGQRRYVSNRLSHSIKADGTNVRYIVTTDLTGKIEAEESLRSSEARFRSIFEHAAVGVARVDEDGLIVEANKKLEEMLGYDVGELVGVSAFEITTAEDSEIEHQLSEELLAGKRESYSMEKHFFCKDGTQILGRLTVSLSKDSKGVIDFTIGVLEDISEYKRVQEALRISEIRYRSIVESAGVGITIVDTEDQILEANKRFQEYVGYSLDELKQMKISEFSYPDDAEKDAILFEEIQEGKRDSYHMEKRFVHRKGETIWTNLTVSVVRNQREEIELVVGITEDITERKKTEEALLASEQRYRELLENLPAGVGISGFDEQLTFVNPAFCEIYGYERDELIGMNVLDTIAPEDHERILSETEKRKTDEKSMYEMPVIRKDGSRRDVRISAVPHRDEKGEIDGTIGLITDISETKRAQESLIASEKRMRSLIEQLPLGVAIANLTERFELVNQAMAEMLWQEKGKLIGSNIINFLEPTYLSKMRDETENRKFGVKSTYDVEMIRTDGVKRNVRITAAPNYDSQGQVIGSIGIFEDNTEQKRNEAIRTQQETEIDLYGSLLRHDLRNDLGLILSYVEAVQMLMQSPEEEVLSFLDSAIASIERMADLLRSFGRPQDVREVDIVEFIREIADEAQEAEKGLQINVSYEEDASAVALTAGSLLALVFMNLFRNAAQHAGEKPQIEIRVSEKEEQLNIIVSDDGPGVPEELQDRLFARGTSSKGEAGGLGLYLCRQILERTGGSIELLKDKKGAAFHLAIPTKK